MAKKILLVDDDLYIRDVYEEVLKGEGYEVTTTADGETGLNKMSEGGFDLVLLDVMMPKMDGIGVLTTLAANPPKTPNGPVLLLTNLASDPIVADAMNKGAKGVFVKSDHTPEEFINEVKKYLS